MDPGGDVTRILERVCAGDPQAVDQLVPLIYPALHTIAERQLRGETPGVTLQATMIADDVFLKLTGQHNSDWKSRVHFLAVATITVRRCIVDHFRARKRLKRSRDSTGHPLQDGDGVQEGPDDNVLIVDELLSALGEVEPLKARIVELRFFGGLTMSEVAEVVGAPLRTVEREWEFARAWLKVRLSE